MAVKKVRLFKIASEINIGKEAIVEYLQSKGYDIKNKPTSILTEEMVDAVHDKFKKEKQAAEAQRKKLQRHKDIRQESKEKELEKQEEKKAKEESEPVEEKPKEVAEEKSEEKVEEEVPKDPERAAVEEKVEEEKPEVKPEEEVPKDPEMAAVEEKIEEEKPEEEKQKDIKGVKVVGKIDIKKEKPTLKKRVKKKARLRKDIDEEEKDVSTSKKKRKPREIDVEEASKDKDKKGRGKKKRKKRSIREQISEKDVDKAIKQTLAGMEESSTSSRSKARKKKKEEREEKEKEEQEIQEREEQTLKLTEYVTTADFADQMDIDVNDVIMKCMELGLMVTINQRLDKDTLTLVADDYGFDVEFVDEPTLDIIEDIDDEGEQKPRSPIVTIMGHVDHGKTSLLDLIRKENVVAGEAGGITQHVGAYMVDLEKDKHITFLDTPGHEAFTAMRARGAKITDIVVLVIAADDSVMPQTKEAISHAKAAEVPIVVAINKIDKPEANPDRIMQQLSEEGVLVEEWGGKHQVAKLSAKTGDGVDQLMEKILLEAEILDLKANYDRVARGTVVEANMNKGLGAVATVVIQKGTLHQGDSFIAGTVWGRVRAMFDEREHNVESAGPSQPVRIIGFDSLPTAGDTFMVLKNDTEARNIAAERQALKREQEMRQVKHTTLDDISKQIKIGGVETLNLIIKADVSGSLEALSDALDKLSRDEVRVNILHKGVGAVNENDVNLAIASGAVIIGFNVNVPSAVSKMAGDEEIEIRTYDIIYDCINDITLALEGMLKPEYKEEITATLEVRDLFKISKLGTIAGCIVNEGTIHRNDNVRLLRKGLPVFEGKIKSLKREQNDAKEVKNGFECGILLEGWNDIQVGDIIEGFKEVEVKRKLK